ncbi:MAG: ABC transporter ATP-binding protein [Elusimicrobia bacterium]|nr:ABC transporter ATP-binding protein [Elusimicrobiota bacterium]
MNIASRLLPYLKPYRLRFVQASIAMLCVAGLNGISVWLLKPVVDYVFVHRDPQMLYLAVLLIPGIFLIKMLLAYTQAYLMSFIGQRITQELRETLFRHLHDLSMDFFWGRRSGEILARVTNDLNTLQSGLHFTPLYLIRDTMTVVVLLFVLFAIHWKFAMIAMTALPLAAVVLVVLGKKMRESGSKSQEIMGEIYHRFQESLQGMIVVKAFNYEEGAIRKFNQESSSFFFQMMRYLRATALSGPLMEFLGSLVLTTLVFYGGKEIIQEQMTPGTFFAFLGSFFAAYDPIKNLARLNSTVQISLASAERIFQVLDEKPAVQERTGPLPFKNPRQGIQLKNVCFRYPGRESWALKNINLQMSPGEVVAIAGPSGSGKTTLAHLLLRLFDPAQGQILVDDMDLREFSIKSLRDHIGLVTQDTILFNDSVVGNVALGKPEASQEEVLNALRAADAASFVQQLPAGPHTLLGDRGIRLSGGQRQRIAIARAILKNPSIHILDEATSNLDTASERSVQQALEKLYQGRTVFVIAHRLSTLQNADRIFAMHLGEIVESGTHAELLAKKGLYAMLYQLQQLEPYDPKILVPDA